MSEQFITKFMVQISSKFNEDVLQSLFKELSIFTNKYDIKPKETSLVLYNGYLPQCYQVYFVTRKIEGMSMKTLQLYDLYLKDFFKTVNKDINDITTNDIRVYLYSVQTKRNLSNRTLDSRRSAIHAFLEWASNEEYILRNPCRNIKKIKYERKEREPLTSVELEQLRNACNTLKDKAIIEMLYSTGCRVTELERLNVKDVNFESNEVTLFGKGSKYRISYLNAKAEIALKNYLNSRKDDNEALFVSDRRPHNRITKAAIEKRVRNIGESANLERRIYPHLIRHTTATDGLSRGMQVEEIQKILGHVNIATTMIYAKVSDKKAKNNHIKCII